MQYKQRTCQHPAIDAGSRKQFSVEHTILFPKGGLDLDHHDYAVTEWGSLWVKLLTPTAVSYEPHIHIRTSRSESPGDSV